MEDYLDSDKVYVLDKNEVLIAVFDKEDEDTIINPRVQETQNAESVFTFYISTNNPKWEEINNPENLYVTDGKVFSTNFEGCVIETISETNEDLIQVTAYERQKLLSRRYVKAWNSETGFEAIDTFMVVVLSNGNLPLKNNGELVNSTHLSGTSGYALDALLYGTGWTTGVCDVEGTFDLETDQVDIYENILKVQQIWGGILVFDSINKIVHHRDETKFLPYDGYEVKYQKNMRSLEKLYNNKIITKLCPLGEGGLNVKSVNNNSEWITDFTYTNTILEGIENNPDIFDSEQLLRWGRRKLRDLCKPRKELTVNAVLLYNVKGHELEKIGLNDIVDVINYNGIENDIEQLRVVSFEHGIWDYSDAVIELSDITLDSTDIFKKNVQATNSINDGTLEATKVVSFFKNGESIDTTLRIIDKTLEETKSDLYKMDDELGARITKNTSYIDSLNNIIVAQTQEIASLRLTLEGLQAGIIASGGNNLLRNSVGFFGNEYWEGTIVNNGSTEVLQNNISKNAIVLQNGNILQQVYPVKNGKYNISFNYKKNLELASVSVTINEETIELTSTDWQTFERIIDVSNNRITIKFTSDSNNSCYIGDLLLLFGTVKQAWTQNSNETQAENVSIGKGIKVESNVNDTYTRIDADGTRIFNKDTNIVTTEFTKYGTKTNELTANLGSIGGILIQEIDGQTWISSLL